MVNSKTIPTNYTQIAEYCNLWRNYDDIQVSANRKRVALVDDAVL